MYCLTENIDNQRGHYDLFFGAHLACYKLTHPLMARMLRIIPFKTNSFHE